MQLKDGKNFTGGLNFDDVPSQLPQGDYPDLLNFRTGSSDQVHGAGIAESLQAEISVLINPDASITYYGSAIGGQFLYSGYEEVQIGTQVWMKKNWDGEYPGSKVYGDDEANADVYGRLYTWDQVMSADFCPEGWHVPTEADWDVLLAYLGGEAIAGGKMKEPDDLHWLTPNTGADDSSGFKVLPGGKLDDVFSLLGEGGLFWIADGGVPTAPVALPATEITIESFMANWVIIDGVSGYYLDVAEDAAFTVPVAGYNNKDVGLIASDSVLGLDDETNYYYRVRAYNAEGTSVNSNTITLITLEDVLPHLIDKSGNIYNTVVIGNQEWIIENYRPIIYADTTPIPLIENAGGSFSDWFMPSKDELQLMYENLHLYGLGGFPLTIHFSSSEFGATSCWHLGFASGLWTSWIDKDSDHLSVRACRTFISATVYALRDTGPAGGLIFNIINNGDGTYTYYEAAPSNQSDFQIWSNVMLEIGTTGTAIGTGQANTLAIIGQVGQWDSAAKLCDDLIITPGGTAWSLDTIGAYCWYDNDITNKALYGALYNWFAINNAHGFAYLERGGVQETGWRVPTEEDFSELVDFLGGSVVAGAKLKEIGNTHWDAVGGTNESGFTALPVGWRNAAGTFALIRKINGLWSSDEFDVGGAWWQSIPYDNDGTTVELADKNYGFSVRLVRSIADKSNTLAADATTNISVGNKLTDSSIIINYVAIRSLLYQQGEIILLNRVTSAEVSHSFDLDDVGLTVTGSVSGNILKINMIVDNSSIDSVEFYYTKETVTL